MSVNVILALSELFLLSFDQTSFVDKIAYVKRFFQKPILQHWNLLYNDKIGSKYLRSLLFHLNNWRWLVFSGSHPLKGPLIFRLAVAKLVSQVVLACLRILREFSPTWARCLIVCQALGRVHNHRVVPISNSPPHSHHGNHPLGTSAHVCMVVLARVKFHNYTLNYCNLKWFWKFWTNWNWEIT